MTEKNVPSCTSAEPVISLPFARWLMPRLLTKWTVASRHLFSFGGKAQIVVFMSADIMSSLCSVPMNNFSKNTRPRDLLLVLKDTLTIENYKLFKACRSVCSPEPLEERYPHPKCENFNTLSQFSCSLLQEFLSYVACMYYTTSRFTCVSIGPRSFLIIISPDDSRGYIGFRSVTPPLLLP